jgi:hypothetical protein
MVSSSCLDTTTFLLVMAVERMRPDFTSLYQAERDRRRSAWASGLVTYSQAEQ